MNDKKADKSDKSESSKILTSFYLSPKTQEKIDDLLYYMKKRLPIGKRRKLTKSIFYETGFRILIEEYNSKGEESALLREILELMKE